MSAQPAPASRKVVTGKCRASYVNVFQPRRNELSGKDEYSMVLLVPKSDTGTVAKLKGAIESAKADKWGAKIPPGVRNPVNDGDGERPNGGPYGEECFGHWVLNVKSNRRPGIVDASLQDVINPDDFGSGDYCRASLNAFAYDNASKGVSFALNNIQVLERGDSLGGSASRPEDDFEAVGAANEASPW